MARRQHLTLSLFAFLVFLTLTYFMSTRDPRVEYGPVARPDEAFSHADHSSGSSTGGSVAGDGNPALGISERILTGGSIAPKLENATAKAELGRASWKLFHTMMARFPEQPTADDRLALQTYIQLFARLYPCGDCAAHFRKLLQKYPPQTSSRNAAAGWACFVHNEVNKRLKKEEFDCSKIGDFYDCGCGEEGAKAGENSDRGPGGTAAAAGQTEELKEREGVTLEKEEGLTRGG
ncbi:hypothetical protein VTH06DRAFT_5654 [Thermothelomyces fergusii]